MTQRNNGRRVELPTEAKVRMVMRGMWMLYAGAATMTLVYQTWLLSGQCTSVTRCGFGAVKALVWTVFWPFYWLLLCNGKI